MGRPIGPRGNYMSHKCIDFRIKKKLLRGNKNVMECKSCGRIKLEVERKPWLRNQIGILR